MSFTLIPFTGNNNILITSPTGLTQPGGAALNSNFEYLGQNALLLNSNGNAQISGITNNVNNSSINSIILSNQSNLSGLNNTFVEGFGHNIVNDNGYSHIEGFTQSSYEPNNTHIEGANNIVNIDNGTSHIEGYLNNGTGINITHIEGYSNTTTNDNYSHNEGTINTISGCTVAHIEGSGHKINLSSFCHIEGIGHTHSGSLNNHLEGRNHTVSGTCNHIQGSGNTCLSSFTYIEGFSNKSYAAYVHLEGSSNTVSGATSHIEGSSNNVGSASTNSHVEGTNNNIGTNCNSIHIEGQYNTTANSIVNSHIEGTYNTAWTNTQNVAGNSYLLNQGDAQRSQLTLSTYTTGLSGQYTSFMGNLSPGSSIVQYTGYNNFLLFPLGSTPLFTSPSARTIFAEINILACNSGTNGNELTTSWKLFTTLSINSASQILVFKSIKDVFNTTYSAATNITGSVNDDTGGKRWIQFNTQNGGTTPFLCAMSRESGTGVYWTSWIKMVELGY